MHITSCKLLMKPERKTRFVRSNLITLWYKFIYFSWLKQILQDSIVWSLISVLVTKARQSQSKLSKQQDLFHDTRLWDCGGGLRRGNKVCSIFFYIFHVWSSDLEYMLVMATHRADWVGIIIILCNVLSLTGCVVANDHLVGYHNWKAGPASNFYFIF